MSTFSTMRGFNVSKLLYPRLKAEIDSLRENEVTRKSIYESNLPKIVREELNMLAVFALDPSVSESAYTETLNLNEDHPFLKRFTSVRASQNSIAIIKKLERPIFGGFDSKGKAFGDFADIPLNIYLGKGMFSDKFTSGEIAMTILHEIGHGRTELSFIAHAFTTSTLAYTATRAMLDNAQAEEKMKVLLEYENTVGSVIESKEKVTSTKDETFLTTVFISAAESINSETNTPSFDVSQCEQSADQFATVAGNGAELASAQGKMKGYLDPSRVPRAVYYILNGISTLLTMGLFLSPIFAIMISMRLVREGNPARMEYNGTKERFERICRTMVIETKDNRLTKAEREQLATQIESIDEMMKLYKDNPSLYQIAMTTFYSPASREKNRTDALRLYESLMANDLHVTANKLKTL